MMEAMLAPVTWLLFMSRQLRMVGISGAAANVARNLHQLGNLLSYVYMRYLTGGYKLRPGDNSAAK